jgi:type I restriction enzyme S subunit
VSSFVKLKEVVLGATGSKNPTRLPDESFVYVEVAAIDNVQKTITGARAVIGAEAPSRLENSFEAATFWYRQCGQTSMPLHWFPPI